VPLSPGFRFGPYEITAPIGAGGMGEVYRARDTRLDRTVAIKVLSEQRSDLRQRFEREARAVSSLSHPHICALFDVGREHDLDYLVMEYLEGETVEARLRRGPIPVAEALRHAIQIADALDHAHRGGFSHRDLKPANIMLTRTGAKLLDFGLAKPRAASGDSVLATQTVLTAEGTIAGTLQYMAPEQLHGKETDARSDIFSFAAVLYEMVSGRVAFAASSPASVIAAILDSEPPAFSTIRVVAPPALDRLVRRCLKKSPEERWQSARDLALELQWIAEGREEQAAAAPRPSRLPWMAAAVLLIAAIAGWVFAWRRESAAAPPRYEFQVLPPAEASFVFGTNSGGSAISPDGKTLAFVANKDGKATLWLRRLDSLETRELPQTEGAYYPFWSPDSRFVGFFTEAKMKKLDVSGSAATPEVICDAVEGRGAAWSPTGTILFSFGGPGGVLHRVRDSGGKPERFGNVNRERGELGHRWPSFLPDGRRYLVNLRTASPQTTGIYLGSLDAPGQMVQIATGMKAVYAPPAHGRPGYLLAARGRTLVAQVFDPDRKRVEAPAIAVAEVGFLSSMGTANYSLSANGVLAFGSTGTPATRMTWFSRDGRELGTIGPPAAWLSLNLSPDQRTVAMWREDAEALNHDIWLAEAARGTLTRLTSHPGVEAMPTWAPDGASVVVGAVRVGGPNLMVIPLRGSGDGEFLLPPGETRIPSDWSRDGRHILYSSLSRTAALDVYAISIPGRVPTPFVQADFNEAEAKFSPNGRWVAYTSNESGRFEIYVQRFPAGGDKSRISTNGGTQPRWRRDGREMYFMAPDGTLMAADVKAGERFEAGAPRALFRTNTPYQSALAVGLHYDVSADGQRFLVNALANELAPMTVVVDWTRLLEKPVR
jgi:Tol biopolymer transport system component